ncbi:hypothetical protein LDENG_00060680, partial [Lucifuga dentata]
TSLNRLQTVQNAAARLLTKANRRSHITPILSAYGSHSNRSSGQKLLDIPRICLKTRGD